MSEQSILLEEPQAGKDLLADKIDVCQKCGNTYLGYPFPKRQAV